MKTKSIVSSVLFVLALTMTGWLMPVQGETLPGEKNTAVEVYYFHFNARCATCRAIESEARTGIDELFGERVRFTACNLDEETGKAKGRELGISGQTLLIVKGDKKVDLTREGFLYARTNPAKFRQILQQEINALL